MTKPRYTNLSLTVFHLLDLYLVLLTHHRINKQILLCLFHLHQLLTNRLSKTLLRLLKKLLRLIVIMSWLVQMLKAFLPIYFQKEQTIENCVNDSFFGKPKIENLTRQSLYDILSVAAKESLCIFENSLYCQIDGVAMGSLLGPTLANAFLCHYEKQWLDSCPVEFKSKLYKRYVHDILVMFQSRDHVKKFINYMNTKHPNVSFTFEIVFHFQIQKL